MELTAFQIKCGGLRNSGHQGIAYDRRNVYLFCSVVVYVGYTADQYSFLSF